MKSLYSIVSSFFLGITVAVPVNAQITTDGSTNTTLTPTDNGVRIDDGDRAGGNLFHSFREFSVPTGSEAFFNNASDVVNIFSRVTGGNISNIDGLIGANGGANLFLINPAGILFGEGARLNLGGSFYGSTADSIIFPNSIEFAASNPVKPILTINAPIGLRFRDNPGDITVNKSVLEVDTGETLAIVGGNVILEGSRLRAEEGRIELGSNTDNNLVHLNQTAQNFVLDYREVPNSGEIQLTQGARLETSGEGGGAISIKGGRISVVDESRIIADTLGSQDGEGINIETNQLVVRDGSQISSSSEPDSQGNSGGIIVNAIESVELIGTSGGGGGNNSGGGGGGGNNSGGGRGNNGGGGGGGGNNGGDRERPSRLQSDARGSGSAGNLEINTRRLLVLDGARISASTIDTPGGGSIIVNASELVEISGIQSAREEPRPGALSVQTRGVGQAGDLTVNTKKLIVRDGAEISASTFGEGKGGNINITATESLEVIGVSEDAPSLLSSIRAETGDVLNTERGETLVGTGDGGNLTIFTGELIVRDGARISVSSNQSDIGSAGNLEITADSIELNQGTLEADTAVREGGNIFLEIENNLTLRNNSTITARAFEDANGGDIDINAEFIVAFPNNSSGDGNDIIARAERGDGGDISITAEALFGIEERPAIAGNRTNDIDASSEFGLDGNVIFNVPDTNGLQETAELSSNVVSAETVAKDACPSERGTTSFIVTGKGGVPPAPNLPLSAEVLLSDGKPITPDISQFNNQQQTNYNTAFQIQPVKTSLGDIYPARGVIKTEDGRVILTAYPTASTFARVAQNSLGCQ
ncbi:MAG: filamentous hemagglutinin N-terminal domain-containing protein [Xenococcaceae cyanobacterium MO_167.B27]|nr:filamentous hemagglutinin N-terminal domain-containing protein [Xenococcaceae cyanobacterium MO_167.B27]